MGSVKSNRLNPAAVEPTPVGGGHRGVQSKVAKVVKMVEEFGPGRTVATVALDTGLKYLAGDLYET
jgi:hypothetical protein